MHEPKFTKGTWDIMYLMNAAPQMYAMLRKFAIEGNIDRSDALRLINLVETPTYPKCRETDFAHDKIAE